MSTHKAYLSLGSNQDPEKNLLSAVIALRETFKNVVVSDWFPTQAVGFSGPDFINAAAIIETEWDVYTLDAWLHALEDRHGRRRDVPRFSSRTLDIDIIFFDDYNTIMFPGVVEAVDEICEKYSYSKEIIDIGNDRAYVIATKNG